MMSHDPDFKRRSSQITAELQRAQHAERRADERHRKARELQREVESCALVAWAAAMESATTPYLIALKALSDAVRAAEDFSPREPS